MGLGAYARTWAAMVALFVCAIDTPAATPMAAAGENHSLALHADGTVRSWGNDSQGQLGVGTVLSSRSPLLVTGLPRIRANRQSIATGTHHVLAIATDGTAWAWGWNFAGMLGDGTTTSRATPVRVGGLTDVAGIAAGSKFSLAVEASGEVWSWGSNESGALGVPGITGRTRPGRVAISTGVAVSAGAEHSLVLDRDGTVWAFGGNEVGQLGDGTTTGRREPARVPALSGVIAISAGAYHSLALKSDGTVWAWGLNDAGQLGDGTTTNRMAPTHVRQVTGIVAIAAGEAFATRSYAVRADGRVWRWGSLADNGGAGPTPVLIDGLDGVRQVGAGSDFAVFLRADGSVWTEGTTLGEALGRAPSGRTPAPVPGLGGVGAVTASASSGYAVLGDGRVYAWGSNVNGALGIGTAINRTTPSVVPGLVNVVQVAAANASYVLRANGTVASWGGPGAEGTSSPAQVQGLGGIVQIATGSEHGVGLRSDGTVWTWGFNDFGQLGRGAFSGNSGDPRGGQVPGLTGFVRVAAAGTRTMAVRGDGTVWAWGRNEDNSLGVASTSQCTSRVSAAPVACTPGPARVPGIDSVVDLAMSPSHALAIRADRGLWAWGNDLQGALGDGTRGPVRPAPAPVAGISDVRKVAAIGAGGAAASIALTGDGSVWSWGDNSRGQLGREASGRTPQGTPFAQRPFRIGGLAGITHVSGGGQHALAVRSDGVVFGWGSNLLGKLGDGTVADQFKPVIVVRENGAGSLDEGDWFLDLDPATGGEVAVDKAFALVAEGNVGETEASVSAQVRVRAADAGRSGNTYVFALAPQNVVLPATDGDAPLTFKSLERGKDLPVACVLAQLNANGQLVAVSAAALQAYASGVLSAQGQSVSILEGVPVANISGATFFVGYGTSGTSMVNGGTNRSAASAPGPVTCRPEPPGTGWWWNPAEDGRGYSIERRGTNLFFAAFLYDVSGRSTWHVASGPLSLDGALFTGELLEARGGQTLGGAYPGFPSIRSVGPITLAFNTASEGTMAWPGGNVPIRRFDIVPNGLATGPAPNMPESGWWWNEQESGRGFFLEWQGATLDIAGFMYDDAGNPVWYLTVGPTAAGGRSFSGTWWSYGSGMTLMGPWRPHVRTNDNVAPVTITFTSATTATMTLPNGRTTNLVRHRF